MVADGQTVTMPYNSSRYITHVRVDVGRTAVIISSEIILLTVLTAQDVLSAAVLILSVGVYPPGRVCHAVIRLHCKAHPIHGACGEVTYGFFSMSNLSSR